MKGAIFMKNTTRFTILQLVTDAMLCAVCAILGYVSLDLTSIKITFESLPILLAALMFGPVDGAMVGAVGTLIYQLLRYGFSATTFLWMLPYIICGFIVGFYAKKHNFSLSRRQVLVLVILNELLITILNTGVIYVDSKLYGYYSLALITGSLAVRFAVCIVKAVIFGFILHPLITALRKNVPAVAYRRGGDRE